jgi:hypothetical protein
MEENNIVVYRHVRLDTNEVFYIGIGNEKRPFVKSKGHRNKWWKHIVDKTEYQIDILFDNLSWEQAVEKEKEFIQLYGRRDLGLGTLVNMTDGGDGILGKKHSEETKQKIALGNKGKIMSEKHKLALFNANIGKKLSEEHKLKLSQVKKGKSLSEEHRLKLTEANKGRILSEESRQKISQSLKNKKYKS